MNFCRHHTAELAATAAIAALAVSLSLAGSWIFEATLGAWPMALRAALVTLSLLAAGGSLCGLYRAYRRQRWALQQHVERLASRDGAELVSGNAQSLSSSAGHDFAGLRSLAELIDQCLDRRAEELRESEHGRAAAEIRAQRAAQRCENLEHVLARLPEPIIVVDPFGELVMANHSAERLFQFDASKAGRRGVAEVIQCKKLLELLAETRRKKAPAQRAAELQIGDQPDHWYSVTARSFPATAAGRYDGEAAHGVVVVLRDVSSQKALQQRNAEFVSSVSHEMKTPLAGIKAYVELLADGDAEDEATREEFLQVINGQADRMQRLIDNLLNLARIEAGVVNVNKQTQSLNELLQQALQVVQPSAEAKRIQLVDDLSDMYLGTLVDHDMMTQAAINLLSNAIKYTPEGGKVTLRSRLAGNRVQFEVEDTGVGLSEEDCEKVFHKFYRVKKDRQMAAGTGLGLPLAKHIVQDVHGGTLRVESRLGQGSKFIITLPRCGQLAASANC